MTDKIRACRGTYVGAHLQPRSSFGDFRQLAVLPVVDALVQLFVQRAEVVVRATDRPRFAVGRDVDVEDGFVSVVMLVHVFLIFHHQR